MKVLCAPRRENGVAGRAVCPVVGEGRKMWAQGEVKTGGELWVSPE